MFDINIVLSHEGNERRKWFVSRDIKMRNLETNGEGFFTLTLDKLQTYLKMTAGCHFICHLTTIQLSILCQ